MDPLHVFLSSPGDVPEERALVLQLLKAELPYDPLLRDRSVTFDVVSWDDPASPTPMPAGLTPQEAVIRFGRKPSECNIVVVVLWSRLGTHLDLATFGEKPGGGPYLSGTEWEFEDAWNAQKRPEILVYRRMERPKVYLDDPDLAKKRHQYDLVEQFFGRFKNPDGSFREGFTPYNTPAEFKERLANDFKYIVSERLRTDETRAGRGAAPARAISHSYEANIYSVGSLSIPYIAIQESWVDGECEYSKKDIKIEVDPKEYQLPEDFRGNWTDYRPDKCRCGLVYFRPAVIAAIARNKEHCKPIFRLMKISYEDYLKSTPYLDRRIPGDPNLTFRDKYATIIGTFDDYYRLPLPKPCGVGIFIISSDGNVILGRRSNRLVELRNRWSYSASGGAGWGGPPNLFKEVARECREEINHPPDMNKLQLFSVGIDPERLVFQCSFVEKTTRKSAEILKASEGARTREHSELIAERFDLDRIIDLVTDRSRTWEPAAQAGLVTLAAKRFGIDAVKSGSVAKA